ncbi:ACP S-malonyltransferase [Tumebacillus lipolyticus]|uniref:[acyl-carrier-protein] S-malonyltransferase n=1 Tax=Tumebacillus lipolyticus TaxID=1280370 RepID=A0ABW4ZU07_9BACL
MSAKIVFMFSGQGSQFYQMGKDLYTQSDPFKRWMLLQDELVKGMIGESIVHLLYHEGKRLSERFDRTLYTHPAIFMVQYALSQVLQEHGIRPDRVVGTSLGEFVSSAVAGVLPLRDALELVVQQAMSFEETCAPGGMIAVVSDASAYRNDPVLTANCELAAVNYQNHFVLSADRERMQLVEAHLRDKGYVHQPLPVSFGFHSTSIDPAAARFLQEAQKKTFGVPTCRMISCRDGQPVQAMTADYLWEAVRQPIAFQEALQTLEQEGACIYLDLGPSGTLANFAKQTISPDSSSKLLSIMTPFQQDLKNLEQALRIKEVRKMLTYVFPGQGSQKVGMGAELFDQFPELTAEADEILGYSIKELCLKDPDQRLGQTEYTQPALYVVNALSYFKRVQETGEVPDYVAGHSLGEYNALLAAGAFDFGTGLRLVKKRGDLMREATGGGMAAVVGFSLERIQEVLQTHGLTNIDIANFNTPSQIVISGSAADIERGKPFFEAEGARMYSILRVSGAFHSRYMEHSQQQFAEFLQPFQFSELKIPVISNFTARPYKQAELKQNLSAQISGTVKWSESIRYLMGKGEMEFVELGPGKVLAGLIKKVKLEAEPLIVEEEHEPVVITSSQEEAPASEPEQQVELLVEQERKEPEKEPEKEEPAQAERAAETELHAASRETAATAVPPPTAIDFVADETTIAAAALGSASFKSRYGVRFAAVGGAMGRGVSSAEMVVRWGKASMLGFFGTQGLPLRQVEEAIRAISQQLTPDQAYGMNLPCQPVQPEVEEQLVELFLRYGVRTVLASGFLNITPALLIYRAQGLTRQADGRVVTENRILAKVTRPEVADAFLKPAPDRLIEKMLAEHKITKRQAELLKEVPMADDLIAEADGGGPTDQASALALLPSICRLRDQRAAQFAYAERVGVGAAGGIGTPEAAAAMFVLGADFIMTGSINQCTVEAGTSEHVKSLLQEINVQDTAYAPAQEMFEMGAMVQVVKKGLFFPARAKKLYDLYSLHNSWQEIDEKTKAQLQEKYFQRSFAAAYEAAKALLPDKELQNAERFPKAKLAVVFKWYLERAQRLAIEGRSEQKVDYQVYCGPALGAFNQWVKGTRLENWRNRHVDDLALRILQGASGLLEVK